MKNNNPENPTCLEHDSDQTQKKTNIIALWSLRILIRLNMLNRFLNNTGGFHDEEVLNGIGLHEFYDRENEIDRKTALTLLKNHLRTLENDDMSGKEDTFTRNISMLKQALSLSQAEIEIIRFSLVSQSSNYFGYMIDFLGEMSGEQAKKAISVILDIPLADIEHAMRAESTLISSGLVRVETGGPYMHSLRGIIDVPAGIKYALSQEHSDTSTILQCFFRQTSEARLNIEDFSHMEKDITLLQRYLQSTIRKDTRGVNILIYGPPGTGKTELVRTLAATGDLRLCEITMQDASGEPIQGNDRFSAFQLSQRLLAHEKQSVIMFDEIEDVFPSGNDMFGRYQTSDIKKAWVNHLLEENPVPAFWLSNTVHQIEESFLRRFDYTLKIRAPTRSVRRRILEKYIGHLPVSPAWLSSMAEHEHLVPAHIERAAKVVSHLDLDSAQEVEETLSRVIGNTLEVMGLPRKPRTQVTYPTRYSLDYLNPDKNLQQLTDGLKHRANARLCLYGAPGTGKTAFGHYLAEQLDKPLLTKRASDLLSKWVGEAEKNIAEMFQEANAEDMVLLLDEADSFLQDRAASQHSWEITQVNELLVQMESFDGVFIASTNLMAQLDAASIRRFDVKIKFDYLQKKQAWRMFLDVLRTQNQSVDSDVDAAQLRLARLDTLTPGDFSTVVRQAQSFHQPLNAQSLLRALEQECEAKPGGRKSIGF